MVVKQVLKSIQRKGVRHTFKRGMSLYCPNLLAELPGLIMYPEEIMIEPTNVCNLRCPLCGNKDMKRKKGNMALEQFKEILRQVPEMKRMVIGITGEPLLNKDVFKMIKAASGKGIKVSMPTNALLLDRFDVNEVLDSGLDELVVSFDGATKKSYETYRVGSDFERVKKAVTKLCHEKRKRKQEKPSIVLQFLVMKHNEHEIEKMKKLAKEIKPDYLFFKSIALWSNITGEDRDDLANSWLPKGDKFSRFRGEIEIQGKPKVCPFVFDNSIIFWNGDIALCCFDFEGQYILGNVFKTEFKKVFKSEKFKKMRKLVLEKKIPMCKDCELTNEQYVGQKIRIA